MAFCTYATSMTFVHLSVCYIGGLVEQTVTGGVGVLAVCIMLRKTSGVWKNVEFCILEALIFASCNSTVWVLRMLR